MTEKVLVTIDLLLLVEKLLVTINLLLLVEKLLVIVYCCWPRHHWSLSTAVG